MVDTDDGGKSLHRKSGSKVLMDRHWVVLQSRIDRTAGKVKLTVFTWGNGTHEVPQNGVMTLDEFQTNFYGYVAAKP